MRKYKRLLALVLACGMLCNTAMPVMAEEGTAGDAQQTAAVDTGTDTGQQETEVVPGEASQPESGETGQAAEETPPIEETLPDTDVGPEERVLDYRAQIVWEDENNQKEERPDTESWKASVQFYRYTQGAPKEEAQEYQPGNIRITVTDNVWAVAAEKLPAEDEEGVFYCYFVKEKEESTLSEGYEMTFTNVGEYLEETKVLYSEGTWKYAQIIEEEVKEDSETKGSETGTDSDISEENSNTGKAGQGQVLPGFFAVQRDIVGKDVTQTVKWNDNNNENGKGQRPTATAAYGDALHLYFKIADGGEVELTEAAMGQIGLDAMPKAETTNVPGDHIWTYTWGNLPVMTGDGKVITYSVKQNPVPAGYITETDATGNITNTATSDYKAEIEWLDHNGEYGTRPENVTGKLKLYQYVSGGSSDAASEVIAGLEITGKVNGAELTLSGQPAYDESGMPYVYYVVEETDLSQNTEVGQYELQYVNEGNYAADTSRLYDKGVVTNTLTGDTTFSVEKKWVDNNSTSRPNDFKLHLYRYALIDESSTMASASPVQGHDEATVPTVDGVITDPNTTPLPKFDADGNRYVYFVIETGVSDDYVIEVDNTRALETNLTIKAEATEKKVALNGSIINNTLEGTETVNATKEIRSLSMDYIDFAPDKTYTVFQLQKRTKGTDSWENVKENGEEIKVTVAGFRSEQMTVTAPDPITVEKYENGVKYEYRYIEVEMSINGEKKEINSYYTDDIPDGKEIVTFGGTSAPFNTTPQFEISRGTDGRIINTLVGKTEVEVEKIWHDMDGNVVSGAGQTPVTITLERNDGTNTADGNLNDADGNPVANLTLSAVDDWKQSFKNLERYDTFGREYEYTIREVAVGGYTTTYDFNKTTTEDRDGNTITKLEAQVVNSPGPGKALYFDVDKVWLDDSNLLARGDVTVAVYRRDIGKKVAGSDTVLNEANLWHKRIAVTPANDTDTVNNYIVMETKIGDSLITDWGDTVTAGQVEKVTDNLNITRNTFTSADEAGKQSADALYNEFQYHVYIGGEVTSDTNADYTVYNQRYGDLTLKIDKTWSANSTTDGAAFEAVRTVVATAGKEETVEKDVYIENAEDKNTWTSSDYPKYDSLGRQYSYTVRETSITEGAATETFDNGVCVIAGNRYVSTVSAEKPEYGKNHTGDKYSWSGNNTLSDTVDLEVNKVWRDNGTGENKYGMRNEMARPDVNFQVYRFSTAPGMYGDGPDAEALVEKLKTDSKVPADISEAEGMSTVGGTFLWDTKHNDWFWSCAIGSVARYDEKGYPYVYLLTETVRGNAGNYETAYYNGVEEPKDKLADGSTPTTTEEVFAPTKDTDMSFSSQALIVYDGHMDKAASDAQYSKTTVNYRKAQRNVTGEKIWLNLPGEFAKTNLPAVQVQLYQSLETGKLYTDGEVSGAVKELSAGKYTYSFGNPTLDRYDAYGQTWQYGVKEVTAPDGYTQGTQVANDFVIKNTYRQEPSTDRVEIKVKKQWDIPAGYNGKEIAEVTFSLFRKVTDKSGTAIGKEELAAEQKYTPGSDKTEKTITFITSDGSDGSDATKYLPYYAPNGQPYQYYVKETVPNGYKAESGSAVVEDSVTGDRVLVGNPLTFTSSKDAAEHDIWRNETSSDNSKIKNTYTDKPKVKIEAKKTWKDVEDIYTTRPAEINLTLYRKTDKLPEEQIGSTESVKADASGNWTHNFGEQNKYATTGEEYQYYVKEAPVSGYETSGSGDGLNVTNTLPVTTLTIKKNWNKQQGASGAVSAMTDKEIEQLTALKAFPDEITFAVQYSEDGVVWMDLTKDTGSGPQKMEQTVVLDTVQKIKDMRDKGISFRDIPKFVTGSIDKERSYRVAETLPADYDYIISDADTALAADGGITVTNTIPVREARIDKVWDDNSNRDDTRPEKLVMTLTRDGEAEQTVSFTLNRENAAKDIGVTNWDTWTTEIFYVPLYKNASTEYSRYLASEGAVAGKNGAAYKQGVASGKKTDTDPVPDGDNHNYFSFANSLDNLAIRAAVTIEGKKTWEGEHGFTTLTRPDEISYTLFVKQTDGTFIKASTDNCGLSDDADATKTATAGTDETYAVSWDKVWKYETNHDEAVARVMEYKVEETDAGGNPLTPDSSYPYTPSYDKESIKGTDTDLTVTAINTMKTTSTKFSKDWMAQTAPGISESFTDAELQNLLDSGVLPKAVKFGVYYSISPDNAASSWTELTDKDGNQVVSVQPTASVDDWKILRDTGVMMDELPQYTRDNQQLSYMVREIGISFNGSDFAAVTTAAGGFTAAWTWSDAAGASSGDTSNTNILPVGSVSVKKVWEDELNRDGSRKPVTVQLYRDGEDDTHKYGAPVTIVKGEMGEYTGIWTNLPVYKNGKTSGAENYSVYTIKETQADGYEEAVYSPVSVNAVAEGDKDTKITVTNTRKDMQRFEAQASKVWSDDDGNTYSTRPGDEKVTLTLQYEKEDGSWADVSPGTLTDGKYADNDGVYTTSDVSQQIKASAPARWENLPANRMLGGVSTKIKYKVVETPVTGYDTAYSYESFTADEADKTKNTVDAAVTNTLQTTKMILEKNWNYAGSENTAGRPNAVGIQIEYTYDNGTTWKDFGGVQEVTADADGNWKKEVTGLPVKNAAGQDYQYRIKESWISYDGGTTKIDTAGAYSGTNGWNGTAGGYTTAVTTVQSATDGSWDGSVANTLETTSVTGTKTWADDDNRDGKRGDIQLQLYRDGAAYGNPVDLKQNADGSWPSEYTWNDLPMYKNNAASHADGERSAYIVQEMTEPTGYTKEEAGSNVKNTHTSESFSISASKVWADDNNKYGLRPGEVELKLQAATSTDGTTYTAFADVTQGSFTGKDGAYTISGISQTLKAGTDGTWSTALWENLPVYSDGQKIKYKVVETALPSYTTVYSREEVTGTNGIKTDITVTNTLADKTSVNVQKIWDTKAADYGALPKYVEVQLQHKTDSDSRWEDTTTTSGTYELQTDEGWAHTFADLPTLNKAGQPYKYRVIEKAVIYEKDGKEVRVEVLPKENDLSQGTADNYKYTSATAYEADKKLYTTTLTNELPNTKLTVSKTWDDDADRDGMRAANVTIQLKRDGKDIDSPVQLNEGNSWKYTWEKLPVYQNGITDKSEYTVEESTIPNAYKVSYTYPDDKANAVVEADKEQKITVTNTHTPHAFTIEATKEWADTKNYSGTRPEEVEFILEYKDADGNWQKVPTEVKDSAKPGVTPVTKTNPQKIAGPEFAGKASWMVQCNQKDGTSKPLTYRVTETAVASYETAAQPAEISTAADKDTKSTVITNTLKETSLTVTKTWTDAEDAFATRPDVIKLQLQRKTADGAWENVTTGVVTAELKKEEKWKEISFPHLPAYADAANTQTYEYRAVETALVYGTKEIDTVPDEKDAGKGIAGGYTLAVSVSGDTAAGYKAALTNTLRTTALKPIKNWDDNNNYYGTRPDSVTVKLQRRLAEESQGLLDKAMDFFADTNAWEDVSKGGAVYTATIKPDTDGNWNVTDGFTGLPETDSQGKTYEHRAVETSMTYGTDDKAAVIKMDETTGKGGGYTAATDENNTTIKNTLNTVDISVEKEWDDQENSYQTRPEEIKLIMANQNGELLTQPKFDKTAAEGNTWSYQVKGLPEYVEGTTELAQYYILEEAVPGYKTDYGEKSVDEQDGVKVEGKKAKFANVLETVELEGTKTWKDYDNKYLTRPTSIDLTVRPHEGELSIQPEFIWKQEGSVWSYQITGLPKYLAGTDTEAVYSLTEKEAEGYEAETETVTAEDGTADFVNTMVMPTKSVSITKHGVNLNGPKLAGCAYILCREKDEGSGVEYFKGYETSRAVSAQKRAVFTDVRAEAMEVVTGADGTATVEGLPYGNFYFIEVRAPEGYALDETPIRFSIDAKNQEEVQAVAQADPKLPEPESTNTTKTDNGTRTSGTTKTGDETSAMSLWFALAASALLGAGIAVRRKKKQK